MPATSWLLSLLALKPTRTRRVSHVDDLLLSDPAAALFAAPATLPKKSALTDYSYRTSHENQRAFLAALDTAMITGGLATREEAIFDLDFHAVMAWGSDPALEKHYVPTRSQRFSVLTFFAQHSGTHNLLLRQRRPVQGHRRTARSSPSATTGWPPAAPTRTCWSPTRRSPPNPCSPNPGARGVTFLTLRMRSPALLRHSNSLRPADYKTITLDRSGRYNRPRVHESTARLSNYPTTVRQLIITGLGRDAATVIITNDTDSSIKELITRYARRMTIEQRLAEIIRAFHADALSSAVNLNVDLDVMLCVLAQALIAALRLRLPGYAAVTPDTLQRRFLETPGQITTTTDTITVRLNRRAYSQSSAKPTSPTPPSPGGATAPSTTNSPNPLPRTNCAEIRVSALACGRRDSSPSSPCRAGRGEVPGLPRGSSCRRRPVSMT